LSISLAAFFISFFFFFFFITDLFFFLSLFFSVTLRQLVGLALESTVLRAKVGGSKKKKKIQLNQFVFSTPLHMTHLLSANKMNYSDAIVGSYSGGTGTVNDYFITAVLFFPSFLLFPVATLLLTNPTQIPSGTPCVGGQGVCSDTSLGGSNDASTWEASVNEAGTITFLRGSRLLNTRSSSFLAPSFFFSSLFLST
jgi:hypothetical protein